MDAAIIARIAQDTSLPETSVAAAVALFEKGATGPFIVHYRKEAIGGLDAARVRSIQECIAHYREVLDQRASLLKFLAEQGKLADELRARIENCFSKAELDDLYHQYRPRKRTRATEAAEKGLEPLAEYFWNQESDAWSVEEHINVFVDPAKGVPTREHALQGVVDIIAEWIWENFEHRRNLREMLWNEGFVVSSVVPAKVGQKTKYNMYYDRRESVTTIPSHRVLAIRRGSKEGILMSSIEGDNAKALEILLSSIIKDRESVFAPILEVAARECYSRILRPLIETEVRTQLKERADREAIRVFQENLANLLLSPPAGPIVVMGVDWGRGDECSVAVLSETGAFLEGARIRLIPRKPVHVKAPQAVVTEPQVPESVPAELQHPQEPAQEPAPEPPAEAAAPEETPLQESLQTETPQEGVAETSTSTEITPEQPPAAETPDSAPVDSSPALETATIAQAEPVEPLVEQAAAEPAEPLAEQAAAEPAEPLAEQAAAEPAEPLVEQATAEPAEPLAEQAAAEPAEPLAEQAAAEPVEPLVEQATAEPAEPLVEQAAAEPAEPLAEQAAAEPAEPLVEQAAAELPNLAQDPIDEIEESRSILRSLIAKHKVQAISIGTGTGARELETALRQIVSEEGSDSILIAAVNDAGIAIYSSSRIAREEFPDWNASARCAVSLARRLQDPLAELVKIDPKLIGVGQYQHDVDQKELHRGLLQTVQYCVNKVGVNANSAGESLLRYVSGLNEKLARRIASYRNSRGPFRSRASLMASVGLDPSTFEQAAGFLRISDGDNPLDRTAVHPESYPIVERMASALGVGINDLIGNRELISSLKIQDFVTSAAGLPTLNDIREELLKPGRDPRRTFKVPKFRADVKEMSDLKAGMTLEGTVTNVTNFGAFVDIGVHQDGLVHLSQMSNRFIRDPREAVKVGDVIQVKVISVEAETKRIGLSMKALLPAVQRRRKKQQRRGPRPPITARQPEGGQAEAKAATDADSPLTSAEKDPPAEAHPRASRIHDNHARSRRRGPRRREHAEEARQQKEHAPKLNEPTLQEKIAILQSKFRRIK